MSQGVLSASMVVACVAIVASLSCSATDNRSSNTSGSGSGASSSASSGSGPGGGGQTSGQWEVKDSGTSLTLRGVWIDPAGVTAFAVGAAGTILQSGDGGESWQAVNSGTTSELYAVFGTESEIYVVGDDGQILHSIGGGPFAHEMSDEFWPLRSVWASDPLRVFIGGADSLLLRSLDGGTTWTIHPNPAESNIVGIWGLDANNVYAISGADLLTTMNGGDQWSYDYVSFSGQTDVWVGTGGEVFITNEEGVLTTWEQTRWVNTMFGASSALYGIWGSSTTDLYIVGQSGLIKRTTDAGATWSDENSGTDQSLRAIHGGATRVLAVGDAGTIVGRSQP